MSAIERRIENLDVVDVSAASLLEVPSGEVPTAGSFS